MLSPVSQVPLLWNRTMKTVRFAPMAANMVAASSQADAIATMVSLDQRAASVAEARTVVMVPVETTSLSPVLVSQDGVESFVSAILSTVLAINPVKMAVYARMEACVRISLANVLRVSLAPLATSNYPASVRMKEFVETVVCVRTPTQN
ncbi:unnamed protein product [Strongylus vulgaris]|uniref:Uncharacterized protein n=1 Tax=Strongylus vulgaris TaxID=40348 RepID=A0A3P7J620_STRVU|nr:unnamed protein product [Strongylus vulgaris]